MAGWNIADVLEVVAHEVPDSPALISGDVTLTWRDLDRRASLVAGFLLDRGLSRQSAVTQYLRNSPEYVESMYACLKGAFVPVNTNYRYGGDELVHLWENADVRAVVFHGEFTPTIERIRDRVPNVRTWLWVDDGTNARPQWAEDYAAVAGSSAVARELDVERSGDDVLLLFTGGTTGLPKGVMWRQDDLFVLTGNAANGKYPDEPDLDYARSRVARRGRRVLPAAPLMHGAGCFSTVPVLARGGAVVLLTSRSFDVVEFLDAIERHAVTSVSWVGDAFAKPVADALDAEPDRWDLSSLRSVTSGGVVFSEETKRRLLERIPQLLINDVFGASESITVGTSVSTRDTGPTPTGTFAPRPDMRVIDERGRDVVPGSGDAGLIAFAGRQPLGYYKDERKSAEVFRTIEGRRYSVPGDWATVGVDGMVTLLGRGAACINTGGEKVFPDEVEKVICSIEGVVDAVVVGIPDERFGQSVVAVVERSPDSGLAKDQVIDQTKARLAHYKAPREVVFVESLRREATGKIDLPALRERVLAALGR